ncbi:hypothetical protein [uncultured Modestobacter sp.]|uniref:hypothetical protein n=1 Tax=uncultured Modestobacter sp. TaxID=380048 RepID=UPI0026147B1A|nr:hypothetical protein [uncultured Modestobacter sp.]
MTFGVALLIVGGFLLGGAFSIFKADSDAKGRTSGQLVFASTLLVAALLATASGILYLVG